MTRINTGIRAAELPREALLAENHEILRIPRAITSGRFNMKNIPEAFTLGKGHVKFFYNKIAYIYARYQEILEEGNRRGYSMTDFTPVFSEVPEEYWGGYKEKPRDRALLLIRLNQRGHKLIKQN